VRVSTLIPSLILVRGGYIGLSSWQGADDFDSKVFSARGVGGKTESAHAADRGCALVFDTQSGESLKGTMRSFGMSLIYHA
jgi:hypothetical protein